MRCKACNRPLIINQDGGGSTDRILIDEDTGEEIILQSEDLEYCSHCLSLAKVPISNIDRYGSFDHQYLSDGETTSKCSTYEFHSGSDYYFSWYDNT